MKEIKVSKWKEKVLDNGIEKEVEVNLLTALTVLVNQAPPESLKKGFDHFRTFNRIARAFDSAEKTGELILDDIDYAFLKDLVEKNIPSSWGRNVEIFSAIDNFMNVK